MTVGQDETVWNTFVTLQDLDSVSGSRLFRGERIYCLTNDFSFGGKAVYGTPNTQMVSMNYIDPGSNIGSVWNDALGYNTFTGTENHLISLTGTWSTDFGSVNTMGSVLTPYKILVFGTCGKRLYLTDERVITQIAIESGSQLYGNGLGIPVVVHNYSLKYSKRDNNMVNWSLTLREDKV